MEHQYRVDLRYLPNKILKIFRNLFAFWGVRVTLHGSDRAVLKTAIHHRLQWQQDQASAVEDISTAASNVLNILYWVKRPVSRARLLVLHILCTRFITWTDLYRSLYKYLIQRQMNCLFVCLGRMKNFLEYHIWEGFCFHIP